MFCNGNDVVRLLVSLVDYHNYQLPITADDEPLLVLR